MKPNAHSMTISFMNSLIIPCFVAAAIGISVSCMNTYDAYGRPVQSVDPGAAVAGAAVAGLAGYAIAKGNDHHDRYYRGHYYRRNPYYRY